MSIVLNIGLTLLSLGKYDMKQCRSNCAVINMLDFFPFCSIGITGIYKGVTPTILKQGSNQAIRFFVMETLKDGYRQYRGDKVSGLPVPKLLTGLFGIVAGAASVYGNTPLDVIKTRMQVCTILF
ncbi:unnamed protein product [Trichobilharzia regenti]|nr:unnamed protein product [Trichobilharzia regenti]